MNPERGHCRCGTVEMEISAPPLMISACHCRGCQRMSASAFSLTMMVPNEGFRVSKGDTERGGLGEGFLDHRHCPKCKSWLFTKIDGRNFVNVRPMMFEVAVWQRPFIEVQTESKLNWVDLPVAHSFPGFPSPDDYSALLADFAAR